MQQYLDYNAILAGVERGSPEALISILSVELPELWGMSYIAMTPHPANLFIIPQQIV
jgi:hypothetical protein